MADFSDAAVQPAADAADDRTRRAAWCANGLLALPTAAAVAVGAWLDGRASTRIQFRDPDPAREE